MIFSSGTFWVLFLGFLPIYVVLNARVANAIPAVAGAGANAPAAVVSPALWNMLGFVVAFSLYFYYKSSGWFVMMLAATATVDWLLSRAMARAQSKGQRRLCLILSLCFSLGILAYFKYANFFLWNFQALVGGNFQPLDLILPVGISFYTFQSVSYMVDVYKRRVEPTETLLEYAFFLTFFPALVAGPIVRADYFLPQIRQRHIPTHAEIYGGLWLILLGIVKKAIIADYIAQYNDLIFNAPGAYGGFETLMAVIGYTMQIYCDFSGYSDMAIGIAAIMGFRLMQNFNFPYKSKNLGEFWHRWHISLSTWLRDYIYIPLGGNRKGTARTYLNNFLTMLIGGLWHGAAWKFVFWGAMHGAGLAVHKACKPWLDRVPDRWWVRALSWLVTMAVVSLLWIYFRAATWEDSWVIVTTIFTDMDLSYALPFAQARSTWLVMMAIVIGAHALPERWWQAAGAAFIRMPWIAKAVLFLLVVQLVVEFRTADVQPFIYFQF